MFVNAGGFPGIQLDCSEYSLEGCFYQLPGSTPFLRKEKFSESIAMYNIA